MIAARPLYPIFDWQALLLDVAQAALDWLAAEMARPAPLLPRPELAVPDPEAEPVGLRRHGRWLVPAPDGRGRWLAPWLLTSVELGWNALPPGVPPRIDRAWRGLCWLVSWVPRPRELARERRCWLALGVALLAVVGARTLPALEAAPVLLALLVPAGVLYGLAMVALLGLRRPSRAEVAAWLRWLVRRPRRVPAVRPLDLRSVVRAAHDQCKERADKMARDILNWQPTDGMRASWSVCSRRPGRFTGVIKEIGTDGWLWFCERALGHAHETRREATACARARIARELAHG